MAKKLIDNGESSSGDENTSSACFVNETCTGQSDETQNPSILESNLESVSDGSADTTELTNTTVLTTPPKQLSIKVAIISLILIFVVFSGSLALVYHSFPEMNKNETSALKFPTSIEKAKALGKGNVFKSN